MVSRIGPAVSANRGGMRVKNLFLYCHNIFSVNELFTELCFRGWFRIEKEPLRAFARDQAAKPKVRAGSSSAFMKHEDSGDGRIPISAQIRVMNGRSVLRRNQATKCKPASGTSRMK